MKIDRIEPITGLHDVYDIEVEIDHSFIVEGCVLHNSQVCKHQDGNEYFYVDGYNQPKPPFHHGGCRTTTTPILSTEYQFTMKSATRPAVTEVDGKAKSEEVSSKTSYYEWLETQPKSVQEKALGKTKADIFRNSGLTASEFKKASSNSLGQSISLEQMKKNNKDIAEYLKE